MYGECIVDNGLGLKMHGGLYAVVDTSSTYDPILVVCPNRREYDAKYGDKIGDEENVYAAGPIRKEYHEDNDRNINGNPEAMC